jgi:hypothetical protein
MSEQHETRSALAEWAEAPPPTNGHGTPARVLPIRSATLHFDDVADGLYAGWEATMRLNPTTRQLRAWQQAEGVEANLDTFARFVVAWNFVGEDGEPIPISGDGLQDVPDDLFSALIRGYLEAFNAASAISPKAEPPSGTTSKTSGAAPDSGAASSAPPTG